MVEAARGEGSTIVAFPFFLTPAVHRKGNWRCFEAREPSGDTIAYHKKEILVTAFLRPSLPKVELQKLVPVRSSKGADLCACSIFKRREGLSTTLSHSFDWAFAIPRHI